MTSAEPTTAIATPWNWKPEACSTAEVNEFSSVDVVATVNAKTIGSVARRRAPLVALACQRVSMMLITRDERSTYKDVGEENLGRQDSRRTETRKHVDLEGLILS